jgi:crotonobetainyl-CoA:carnitine CoA-transferase CaiB-like acyl-CoA transferase
MAEPGANPNRCNPNKVSSRRSTNAKGPASEGSSNARCWRPRSASARAAGVPCGPVYNYAQMFADPQVRHRGLVQYARVPELGEVPHIGTPVRIGEGVRVRNIAPKLGEHNAEIFGRLGLSEADLREFDPMQPFRS